MTRSGRAALAGAALAISMACPAVPAQLEGFAEVVDADTLTVGAAQVRLHGIDAPEAGQRCERASGEAWRCALAAEAMLAEMVEGERISCTVREVDAYGRLISVRYADCSDVAGALVDAGLAWAFIRYGDDYSAREAAARAAGLRVWREGSDPTPPWDYRANRWERAAAASPRSGCPIKGNISRTGERIYHTPWSKWYERTQVDEAKGERWFCDEAEAAAAGWRPARSR